jgi:hypothetical protein
MFTLLRLIAQHRQALPLLGAFMLLNMTCACVGPPMIKFVVEKINDCFIALGSSTLSLLFHYRGAIGGVALTFFGVPQLQALHAGVQNYVAGPLLPQYEEIN